MMVFVLACAALLVWVLFAPSGVERSFWAGARRWEWDPDWSAEPDESVDLADILNEDPNPAPPLPRHR